MDGLFQVLGGRREIAASHVKHAQVVLKGPVAFGPLERVLVKRLVGSPMIGLSPRQRRQRAKQDSAGPGDEARLQDPAGQQISQCLSENEVNAEERNVCVAIGKTLAAAL